MERPRAHHRHEINWDFLSTKNWLAQALHWNGKGCTWCSVFTRAEGAPLSLLKRAQAAKSNFTLVSTRQYLRSKTDIHIICTFFGAVRKCNLGPP